MRWYYHWIVSLPSCVLCIALGIYMYKLEQKIHEYSLHITNINSQNGQHAHNHNPQLTPNIIDGLTDELELNIYSRRDHKLNQVSHQQRHISVEMTKVKQLKLEKDWKKEFGRIVKPAVNLTHGITVPNEIWNIILQYTMSNDITGYIQNKFDCLVKRQKKM